MQRAYRLADLIPSSEALAADVVRLQPMLREAREQIASAKEAWLKAASGRTDIRLRLRQILASVDAKAREIGPEALARLTAALGSRFDQMGEAAVAEPVAIEFATALLLVESAFGNHSNLSPEFREAGRRDARAARRCAGGARIGGRGAGT